MYPSRNSIVHQNPGSAGWCKGAVTSWAVLLAAIAVPACLIVSSVRSSRAADPYVVTVDMTPWIKALASDDLFESEPAASSLIALGTLALPALSAAMEREGPAVRRGIVDVLHELALPEGAPLLIRAAQDPDWAVREEAILALGFLGEEQGRQVVEAALSDERPEIVGAAAVACGRLCRSPQALRRLVAAALRRRTMMSARQSLRAIISGEDQSRAATARAAIEELARPVLTQADTSPNERLLAALLVADAGSKEAVPVLREAVQGKHARELCSQAILALGSIKDRSAVTTLGELVEIGDAGQRAAACAALGLLARDEVPGAAAALRPCGTAAPAAGQ